MVCIDLSKKIAVVTGAGKGLGEAIALKLGEAGAQVVVSDVDLSNAERTAKKIADAGGKAKAVKTDVSSEQQVNDLVNGAEKEFGSVDIMVNNAGISIAALFLDSTSEEFDKMININLKGTYFGCKAALPIMIKNGGGNIVNVSSMSAKSAANLHALYGATKCGIIGMTRALASEYGEANIKANCICPGIIRTDMWDRTLSLSSDLTGVEKDPLWDGLVQQVLLRRPQSPEDIANTVLFLCSDLAENITAQAININGGQTVY